MRVLGAKKTLMLPLCVFVCAIARLGWSESAAGAEAGEEKTSIGLNIEMEISSLYNWRGINVFQLDSQHDQTGLFAPSITWSIGDTGLSFNYWGAYQIRGRNADDLIDEGVGREQDLVISYERDLIEDKLSLTTSLSFYLFPFAVKEVAGAGTPTYVEPLVGITYAGACDFGLNVSYYRGMQEVLKEERFIYINPTVSKSMTLTPRIGLDTAFGFGIKRWDVRHAPDDNRLDWGLHFTFPVTLTDRFYVTPGIHTAWTNLDGMTAGQETMVYGSVIFGVDF